MSHRRNGSASAMDAVMVKAQRKFLQQALARSGWNITSAAKCAGLSRSTMWRLVRQLKLMKPGKVMVRRLVKA